MVSLWPWKGNDTSTASFEKTLSALSTKISSANVSKDRLKTRSRRLKALWTLYSSFAYILYSLILILITGQSRWGLVEYIAISGGPFAIFAIRYILSAYYNYRLSVNQAHLNDLNRQKDDAVDKFKKATKYDTTQQLLEKYGAAPATSPTESPASTVKRRLTGGGDTPIQLQQRRTGFAPPPTANIRRPDDTYSPSTTPQQAQSYPSNAGMAQLQPLMTQPQLRANLPPNTIDTSAEFAPNAFVASPQYSDSTSGSRWYDRLMDVLLGEDETRPINRLALICSHCKLVNGQAPPSTKRLEDVGRWRCSSCNGWNGQETEVQKIIGHAQTVGSGTPSLVHAPAEARSATRQAPVEMREANTSSEEAELLEQDPEQKESSDDAPPARSTRSKRKTRT